MLQAFADELRAWRAGGGTRPAMARRGKPLQHGRRHRPLDELYALAEEYEAS